MGIIRRQRATDNFNRADAVDLGANWTVTDIGSGGPGITSNQVVASPSGGVQGAHYSAITFANDQYSRATITALVGGTVSVTVRVTPGVPYTGIRAQYDLGNHRGLVDLFVFDQLGDGIPIPSLAIGDQIELWVVKTHISVLVNGVVYGDRDTEQIGPSGVVSGSPGLQVFQTTSALDDWEGGDLVIDAATLDWQSGYAMSGGRKAGMVPSGMTN